jgi:hypothetical protein
MPDGKTDQQQKHGYNYGRYDATVDQPKNRLEEIIRVYHVILLPVCGGVA